MTGPLEVGAGRILGRYRLVARIGAGGMGEVYRAEDIEQGRILAVKVLPSIFVESRDRVARFEREARIASSLRHPNIAVVYEVGEADGVHFIAMEYVEGRSLSSWLEAEKPPLGGILRVMEQVGEALARAHESGVLHRDLKPANVIVTRDGHAKLLDFGLAKVSGESGTDPDAPTQEHLTRTGMVMGTMAYMSPEQAKGHQTDRRSDIFSFGILVYEAVAGIHPFPAGGGLEAATGVLRDDPIPMLRKYGAPRDVVRLVAKALEKEPSRRYQYMDDVVVDLRAVRQALESGALDERPPMARRLRWWQWLGGGLAAGLAAGATSRMPFLQGRDVEATGPLPIARSGVRVRPIAIAGLNQHPSLSSGGDRVCYSSNRFGSFDILTQDVATGRVLRVTDDLGDELEPQFSPDGQTIAFATADGKLRTVPALGGTVRTLAESDPASPVWTPEGASPVWSPDGAWVCYERRRQLFVVSRTGGDPRRVTSDGDPAVLTRPAWAPDGRWIVYSGVKEGHWVLARVPPSGGGATVIGQDVQALGRPLWSPDGRWLLGSTGPPRTVRSDLWILPVEDGGITVGPPQRLFAGVFQHSHPSLSQGSRRLAFEVREPAYLAARIALGAHAPAIPDRLPGSLIQPAISPDGQTIVGVTLRLGRQGLWRMSPRTGDLDTLMEGPGEDERPAWSPDGRSVAFTHIESGSVRIAVVSSSGGSHALISEPQLNVSDPAWSPEGRKIAFVARPTPGGSSLRIVGVAGGPSIEVVSSPYRMRRPSWSPDGRWIAVGVFGASMDPSVAVVSSAGGALRDVLARATAPLWLKGRIVFLRPGSPGNLDMWEVPVGPDGAPIRGDGAALTRLPPGQTIDEDVGPSTDGRLLYFGLQEMARSEIWLAEAP